MRVTFKINIIKMTNIYIYILYIWFSILSFVILFYLDSFEASFIIKQK